MQQTTNDGAVHNAKLAWCLLLLRLGVAIVFIMWAIDKLINPDHAAVVFKIFYNGIILPSGLSIVLGIAQLAIVLAFTLGFLRTYSYTAILIMHVTSTVASYPRFLDPWANPNLLFFAAFPMLAACITLWVLRNQDSISIDGWRSSKA